MNAELPAEDANEQEQLFEFSFADQKKGVVRCSFTVSADNRDSAFQKFFSYLTELKQKYTLPPSKSLTNPRDLGRELLKRLSSITDPVAYVLTLHLFTEFWINQILWKFCPNKDLSKWDYVKKLDLVFGMKKIPKNLWVNLQKLNTLRVHAAHSPDFDFTTIDLSYRDCHPLFQLSGFKPSYAPDSEQHHIFNVIGLISTVTYWPLHEHCMNYLMIGRNEEGKMTTFAAENAPEE